MYDGSNSGGGRLGFQWLMVYLLEGKREYLYII